MSGMDAGTGAGRSVGRGHHVADQAPATAGVSAAAARRPRTWLQPVGVDSEGDRHAMVAEDLAVDGEQSEVQLGQRPAQKRVQGYGGTAGRNRPGTALVDAPRSVISAGSGSKVSA